MGSRAVVTNLVKTIRSITINTVLAKRLPGIGSLVQSHNPNSAGIVKITGIRHLSGQGKSIIFTELVHKSLIPVGTEVASWPKFELRHKGHKGPMVVQEPKPIIIETHVKRLRTQRLHVLNLLADDRNQDRIVSPIRIQNKTAENDEWRDPEDLNANRRTPRMIAGYRSFDVVSYMLKMNMITPRQARSARKIRDAHDRGVEGIRPGYDRLQQAATGFGPSDGISEARSIALEQFNQARDSIGPTMWPIVEFVVLGNKTVAEFAKRTRMHHYRSNERLSCALDSLSDFYAKQDDIMKRKYERPA